MLRSLQGGIKELGIHGNLYVSSLHVVYHAESRSLSDTVCSQAKQDDAPSAE